LWKLKKTSPGIEKRRKIPSNENYLDSLSELPTYSTRLSFADLIEKMQLIISPLYWEINFTRDILFSTTVEGAYRAIVNRIA
jgi:hypothetical protein